MFSFVVMFVIVVLVGRAIKHHISISRNINDVTKTIFSQVGESAQENTTTKPDKYCEYCDSLLENNAKTCSNCGATMKRK